MSSFIWYGQKHTDLPELDIILISEYFYETQSLTYTFRGFVFDFVNRNQNNIKSRSCLRVCSIK